MRGSYTSALQRFVAEMDQVPYHVTCGAVDRSIDRQHPHGLAPATMNRRLYVLKHVFDFLPQRPLVSGHPRTPRHVLRRARTRPRALA